MLKDLGIVKNNGSSSRFFSLIDKYILLLLVWPLCTDGMHIVGRWCFTPYTEAKETLYSVPKWLNLLLIQFTDALARKSYFYPSLSLFLPVLFRLRRCCRRLRLPCLHQVNVRLILPSHTHLCPWCPIRPLPQVQKRSTVKSSDLVLHRSPAECSDR